MKMAKGVVELTDSNFATETAQGVTLVDFWAPWCGPCVMQGPILEKVAARVGAQAKIAKVNVDENSGVAAQFAVRSIPTLLLFQNGKPVKQFIGVQDEGVLVSAIEDAK
jgi:thioredoxin 1